MKKKGKEREEGKRDEEGNIVPPLRAAARRCHATALSRLTYLSRWRFQIVTRRNFSRDENGQGYENFARLSYIYIYMYTRTYDHRAGKYDPSRWKKEKLASRMKKNIYIYPSQFINVSSRIILPADIIRARYFIRGRLNSWLFFFLFFFSKRVKVLLPGKIDPRSK